MLRTNNLNLEGQATIEIEEAKATEEIGLHTSNHFKFIVSTETDLWEHIYMYSLLPYLWLSLVNAAACVRR